jgi:hypothetical protein
MSRQYKTYKVGSYNGQIKKDLPHGNGIMDYRNGSRYNGQFSNGKKHGYGKLRNVDGSTYDGDFMNDLKDGYGKIYTVNNILKFEGQFKNDIQSGTCISYYKNMIQYKGIAENRDANGEGEMNIITNCSFKGDDDSVLFIDGAFKGIFKNNKAIGSGILTFTEGNVYTGPVNDEMKMDGVGELVCKSDDIFKGFYKGIYKGSFKDNKRHGFGTMRYLDNPKDRGYWISNEFVGRDQCSHCLKFSSTKLQTCGQCKIPRYCNRDCQSRAWIDHKCDCLESIINT